MSLLVIEPWFKVTSKACKSCFRRSWAWLACRISAVDARLALKKGDGGAGDPGLEVTVDSDRVKWSTYSEGMCGLFFRFEGEGACGPGPT